MRHYLSTATALCLTAGGVHAGGIERDDQSFEVLFEEGRYIEFSFARVSPDVSGEQSATLPGSAVGSASGDMTPAFNQFGFAYKADINQTLSYAVIYNQPYGADVSYPTDTTYFARSSTAELESHALTAILKYSFPSAVSVYGGLRYQTIAAEAFVPFATAAVGPLAGTPYRVDGDRDGAWGYVVGAAYERPEIALRVGLTYQSAIDHELDTVESSVRGLNVGSVTEFETPESLTLDFRTGIAPKTLLFGSVRWVDWSSAEIAPAEYVALVSSPLVFYADDRITYTLGLGRQLNAQWAVAGAVSYEEHTDSLTGNLGPTDGLASIGLSAVYTQGNMKITTGVSYTDVGNADTTVGTQTGGIFSDNEAVAFGVKIGYTF